MEILQGSFNRDEYYSIKECAQILGLTTKTIRNRINDKKLLAVWNDTGKGTSQWLIPKSAIEVNASLELVNSDLSVEKFFKKLREENYFLRNELAEIRKAQIEMSESQQQIEKILTEIEKEKSKTIWTKIFRK